MVSGDFDYLLKTRVADMAAYRKLLGTTLLRLPGVNAVSYTHLCKCFAAEVEMAENHTNNTDKQ